MTLAVPVDPVVGRHEAALIESHRQRIDVLFEALLVRSIPEWHWDERLDELAEADAETDVEYDGGDEGDLGGHGLVPCVMRATALV